MSEKTTQRSMVNVSTALLNRLQFLKQKHPFRPSMTRLIESAFDALEEINNVLCGEDSDAVKIAFVHKKLGLFIRMDTEMIFVDPPHS